jgi:hypothetical protein
MCVSRSGMKDYSVDTSSQPVKIFDKKGQGLTLQKIIVEGSTDTWLRVHSHAKAVKESGMNSHFSQRFEEGLLQIKESIGKKKGIKKQEKVWERMGRLNPHCSYWGKRLAIPALFKFLISGGGTTDFFLVKG